MKAWIRFAWALLIFCCVAWPISHLLPQSWKEDIILALSWFSPLLTAVGILVSVHIREDIDAS